MSKIGTNISTDDLHFHLQHFLYFIILAPYNFYFHDMKDQYFKGWIDNLHLRFEKGQDITAVADPGGPPWTPNLRPQTIF